jgi:hypothetical protein
MTIDEKDEMIKHLLADCDTAMIATAALTQSEEGTVIEHKVSNKDFVQSSR